jgi:site-specific DNA-methyltransferase (adenine-specific)
LNIDESRIKASAEDIKKTNRPNHVGNFEWLHEEKTAFKLGQGADISQGRWPANLLLDEQAAKMLDEQSGTLKSGKFNQASKSAENSIYGKHDGYADPKQYEASSGGASRFFYCAKASKSERNAGLEGMPERKLEDYANGTKRKLVAQAEGPKNPNLPRANHHPTVKPLKLMEYLIKLITPPGGTVLDPFMGSGSTGVAAFRLGYKFIGIEMNKEYVEIAEKRIEHAQNETEQSA